MPSLTLPKRIMIITIMSFFWLSLKGKNEAKGNNKWKTWSLTKIGSTHFSSNGERAQEERGSNCTVRYFSNKVKFPDNEEFATLELSIGKECKITFPEICKEIKRLLGDSNAQRQKDGANKWLLFKALSEMVLFSLKLKWILCFDLRICIVSDHPKSALK